MARGRQQLSGSGSAGSRPAAVCSAATQVAHSSADLGNASGGAHETPVALAARAWHWIALDQAVALQRARAACYQTSLSPPRPPVNLHSCPGSDAAWNLCSLPPFPPGVLAFTCRAGELLTPPRRGRLSGVVIITALVAAVFLARCASAPRLPSDKEMPRVNVCSRAARYECREI